MHLEINIEKNFLWSKVKQVWALLQKIHFKLTWNWRNKTWSNKNFHYQPFVVRSVSLSKCKHFRNMAMQNNQLKTWRTDRETPIQQMKQLYSLKKEVKEKLHLIFINFVLELNIQILFFDQNRNVLEQLTRRFGSNKHESDKKAYSKKKLHYQLICCQIGFFV